MTTKIRQALWAGIVGTAVMTLMMMLAAMMGMPKMSPPDMLASMMGFPIAVGWVLHFMIGIIFASAYVFLFAGLLKKINNNILKGSIFGMAVFIFAQIMMAVMGTMLPMPAMEGSMVLMMVGSVVGHIVFGITVALFAKEPA